jgi:DNA-binding FrmR family transcriptional regulator
MDKELRGQMQSAQIPESKAEEAGGCCCRTKSRTEKEQRDLINRLSRIEGQIRGLKGMVERDAYCIDIINQAAAANSALSSFSKELLSCHIRTCVEEDIREGREEKVEELVKTLQKLLR